MNKEDLSSLRLTIDYMDDLIVVQKILNLTKKKYDSSYNDIIRVIKHNNKIMKLNSSYTRNSGSKDSENQKLWERAKTIIPGGNMLIQKDQSSFYLKGGQLILTKPRE